MAFHCTLHGRPLSPSFPRRILLTMLSRHCSAPHSCHSGPIVTCIRLLLRMVPRCTAKMTLQSMLVSISKRHYSDQVSFHTIPIWTCIHLDPRMAFHCNGQIP